MLSKLIAAIVVFASILVPNSAKKIVCSMNSKDGEHFMQLLVSSAPYYPNSAFIQNMYLYVLSQFGQSFQDCAENYDVGSAFQYFWQMHQNVVLQRPNQNYVKIFSQCNDNPAVDWSFSSISANNINVPPRMLSVLYHPQHQSSEVSNIDWWQALMLLLHNRNLDPHQTDHGHSRILDVGSTLLSSLVACQHTTCMPTVLQMPNVRQVIPAAQFIPQVIYNPVPSMHVHTHHHLVRNTVSSSSSSSSSSSRSSSSNSVSSSSSSSSDDNDANIVHNVDNIHLHVHNDINGIPISAFHVHQHHHGSHVHVVNVQHGNHVDQVVTTVHHDDDDVFLNSILNGLSNSMVNNAPNGSKAGDSDELAHFLKDMIGSVQSDDIMQLIKHR